MNTLNVGDMVTRMFAGEAGMQLKITAITATRVICGPWEFDRATGAEIDEELGWGPPPLGTGSYLQEIVDAHMGAVSKHP
jgi:hypothetical protein